VIVFIKRDCPISNAYASELAALGKDLAAKSVPLYLVHVERDLAAEKAAEHAKEFGLPAPVLLDPNRALVRAVGATMTPEAAVITHGGAVAYLGRIDDRHPKLGVRKPEPSKRDLREAIDAVLAGKPVPEPRTKAVGCIIE
jgi:AhpC/TSA family